MTPRVKQEGERKTDPTTFRFTFQEKELIRRVSKKSHRDMTAMTIWLYEQEAKRLGV